MKTMIFSVLSAIGLAILGFSDPAMAAQFACVAGQDRIEILIDDMGRIVLSDGARPAAPSQFNCVPHGAGGQLFKGGNGPNTWGYRIKGLSPYAASIQLTMAWDEDSDGEACQNIQFTCVRMDSASSQAPEDSGWSSPSPGYYSGCNILGDGCYGFPLPNGPS